MTQLDLFDPRWMTGPLDRSGAYVYTHLIMGPNDPQRSPRPKGGRKDRAPHLTLRKAGVEVWRMRILDHLSDDIPRTFNRICVELADIEGSVGFQESPDHALWQLVAEEKIEHTAVAPILFRLRRA